MKIIDVEEECLSELRHVAVVVIRRRLLLILCKCIRREEFVSVNLERLIAVAAAAAAAAMEYTE